MLAVDSTLLEYFRSSACREVSGWLRSSDAASNPPRCCEMASACDAIYSVLCAASGGVLCSMVCIVISEWWSASTLIAPRYTTRVLEVQAHRTLQALHVWILG